MPDAFLTGRVRIRGELDSRRALDLLEALREERDHRRAGLLCAIVADLHRDPAKPGQRNALRSFSKKLSSCR